MVYTYNPSTWDAEAEGQIEARPAWATESLSQKESRGEGQGSDFEIDTIFTLAIKYKRNKKHRLLHSEEPFCGLLH